MFLAVIIVRHLPVTIDVYLYCLLLLTRKFATLMSCHTALLDRAVARRLMRSLLRTTATWVAWTSRSRSLWRLWYCQ